MKIMKLMIATVVLFAAVFWLPETVSAQDGSNTAEAQVGSKNIIDYYKAGGITMHVLLVGLIATVALTVYLFMTVNSARMVPRKLVDGINQSMSVRDLEGAYALANQSSSPYSKCISQALLKVNFERDLANKNSMVVAAEDTLDQEETKVNGLINYLNTISTLAPMVGLFGTVIGMIAAFEKLMAKQNDASDLAGGIGTAMLTTAGGLLVGIPAMFFYFYFKNRLAGVTSEIQKQFNYAIDVLSGELQLETAAQQPVAETQPAPQDPPPPTA